MDKQIINSTQIITSARTLTYNTQQQITTKIKSSTSINTQTKTHTHRESRLIKESHTNVCTMKKKNYRAPPLDFTSEEPRDGQVAAAAFPSTS